MQLWGRQHFNVKILFFWKIYCESLSFSLYTFVIYKIAL